MIPREAEKELIILASQFKAVAVTGPRQSGKTTLVRNVFPDKPYANLENPDIRKFAAEDPKGFLAHYRNGAILDEVQRAPELFSYLQQLLDEGLKNVAQLSLSPYRGSLFENLVIVEFLKNRYNQGKTNNLSFWRDNTGNEIDLVMETGNVLHPVEIKSGKTVTVDYFKNLRFWKKLTGQDKGSIIYDGDSPQYRTEGIRVVPLRDMHAFSI
jgi:predicted AAA+ superfamily ATPase